MSGVKSWKTLKTDLESISMFLKFRKCLAREESA